MYRRLFQNSLVGLLVTETSLFNEWYLWSQNVVVFGLILVLLGYGLAVLVAGVVLVVVIAVVGLAKIVDAVFGVEP